MNNLIAFFSFKSIYMCAFLSFICVFAFAQKTATIKGVKTDNAYANTTEISKSKNATDEQVLAEIEGNYGIGDIVRIVVTTPKPTIDPLAKRGNDKPVETSISTSTKYNTEQIATPTIALTQSMPPIQPKTAPQQPTTPPQYSGNKQPNIDAPSINLTQSMPPIQPKNAPQQPTTPPQYSGNKQPNIDAPGVSKSETQTPNLPSKMPNIDNPSREMAIPPTKMDGTPIEKVTAYVPETVTTVTVKEQSPFSPTERIERRTSSITNKADRSTSSSWVSKKSGYSVKKMSSLFKKTSYKKAKYRKVKNRHKDKCYKF